MTYRSGFGGKQQQRTVELAGLTHAAEGNPLRHALAPHASDGRVGAAKLRVEQTRRDCIDPHLHGRELDREKVLVSPVSPALEAT